MLVEEGTDVTSRNLLLDRIPTLVIKHFGAISKSVDYEGAVWIPAELPLDCRELAEIMLTEDTDLAEVFSSKDIAQHLESIVVSTVREGTGCTHDLIEQLCSRLEKRDEWKVVLIPLHLDYARCLTRRCPT